ncbi:hypothetical protein P7K49_024065 [Saguinus oedipus]|uniref:Plectin/eS10 N-terminal domain-containing protein n=1 Tax=Saguinus oedipus TaxID=9490 RepID=A0ABQ9UNG4_SAGOE|nr:hypothetical protein P7K49_024065 [Saguinus oedipus]
MPKKNRIAIYELFKEGVMVAKKDVHMPKYPELADENVPNLHVMNPCSLSSPEATDRACHPTLQPSRQADLGLKVWKVSHLQDSREEKPTEIPTAGVLCHLVPTRKPRWGCVSN